ncbi:hypothetical protein FRX31_032614 [Thalictrum thalictroides]|uniref:Uncharacterized protein n=1 Tax=Thalictrum thalictroides TaxID=46969 RepID=A0A7J6UZE1_THATH|nr:hypothetical protein FRX31_032614 [Thalictrum thalictroides]
MAMGSCSSNMDTQDSSSKRKDLASSFIVHSRAGNLVLAVAVLREEVKGLREEKARLRDEMEVRRNQQEGNQDDVADNQVSRYDKQLDQHPTIHSQNKDIFSILATKLKKENSSREHLGTSFISQSTWNLFSFTNSPSVAH